LRLFLFLIHFY